MRLSDAKRREIALSIPEGKQTARDPRTAIKRMVKQEGHPDCQFWSQFTVELDSPPVWRLECWYAFDQGRDEIEVSGWNENMISRAVGEMHSLIPNAESRKVYREMTRHGFIWRSPLEAEEIGQALVGEIQH